MSSALNQNSNGIAAAGMTGPVYVTEPPLSPPAPRASAQAPMPAPPQPERPALEVAPAPEEAWAWRRGEGVVVAVNLGTGPVEVAVEGRVALATDRGRDGELVGSRLALRPAEGAVLVLR